MVIAEFKIQPVQSAGLSARLLKPLEHSASTGFVIFAVIVVLLLYWIDNSWIKQTDHRLAPWRRSLCSTRIDGFASRSSSH